MKVAILGAGGMLGRALLAEVYRAGWTPIPYTRSTCDVTDGAQVFAATVDRRPDAVVNCAGVVPGHKPAPEMAHVNAVGPHVIAACTGGRIPFVHVSTDCVFSGAPSGRAAGHAVTERPDPVDLYGRSKLTGEPEGKGVAVVRTSFVGFEHGLLAWLLSHPERGKPSVPGWANARWSGSTVYAVARAIRGILETWPGDGVHHLATQAPISKADALELLARHLKLRVDVERVDEPVIDRALEPTIPLRPFAADLDELRAKLETKELRR